MTGRVSGHSLRVGGAQSLASAGASLAEMQAAGRWSSPVMPGRYAQGEPWNGEPWRSSATAREREEKRRLHGEREHHRKQAARGRILEDDSIMARQRNRLSKP